LSGLLVTASVDLLSMPVFLEQNKPQPLFTKHCALCLVQQLINMTAAVKRKRQGEWA
jgi:hypothetical protein